MNSIFPDTTLSVGGLTSYLKELLEGDRNLRSIWLTGEVSNVSRHSSGCYFTLRDPDTSAAITCVVWTYQQQNLRRMPVKGEQLLVFGSIQVYEPRGDYKLIVSKSLPGGEGLEALRLQQLRSRLEAEGFFDRARKRPIPAHPQIVAVVTSDTGAAWGDIQRTLAQRYQGLQVLLSPTGVQGDLAAAAIVRAIARVELDGRADVIILGRGGGSAEDLACFNDERVVRAIANCTIPIITGIGHERDESLADLVADKRAHTPTAAATQAVPILADIYWEHRQRMLNLASVVRARFQQEEQHLQQLQNRLKRLPATSRTLRQATGKLEVLQEKLAALNPAAVLERGYAAVIQGDGTIVRETEGLELGEELTVRLSRGVLKVKIVEVLDAE
ncbi:MAG: exodeoxyribonuclease VII large subunit [Microcoleus sp. PH2017_25_DOB_D_A]|uniref:exodeoxyribonuclease VII large subunit n=1 Tax=unclassified Microcoleus TaxID=2642155 RepID=UPI001D799B80|nr:MULTISPECIES: exodeoxyribonuclease VII large subunit [unclassified Microcoleus]TAE12793.1 MAG: exodeoxyribonuclease VII large subunit [Oscillatoriales cyanobacterium]MCC3489501.1 exodeoxyribonuclease VII large subunit [Microcoleus sp. PH2017_16_JOR_D_A]MCC3532980.1 exodeoxyribonuclease VII large subunit [Microcoleus sp. PH2017_25_DOB_D_A]MCC3544919.1 exodeoxyribonuclease VII large subunit [Microcoleus sp. PH2017_24_DOB_U_A]TAE24923.1 MAG: exodeoxyribonuclease VII large subunit [Oscillatoria